MAGVEIRIQAFVKLGRLFRQYVHSEVQDTDANGDLKHWLDHLDAVVRKAEIHNGWFTRENVLYALGVWGELLKEDSLKSWLSDYPVGDTHARKIAVITAGNIPLVGFHDLLCVLICGHQGVVKCSSNDSLLLPFVSEFLKSVEPGFEDKLEFQDGILEDYDAVIATGSNNTARYFDYYFSAKPHIIRRNRTSVAVITGDETSEDLALLGEDIFRYFGLGCRSVSKLFVPKEYNFDKLFQALYPYRELLNHQKYVNNYDYNKAVYLISEFNILDNGFFMLKEDASYASPIATLFYEYYESPDELRDRLIKDREQIQCVVANGFLQEEVGFGQTQQPALSDYADGVDTVEFLLRI